jgi:hypothetical protein
MQRQRLGRAERYRKEANKFAELAKVTAEPRFLVNLYRQTAVRYVLMAEDLERSPDPKPGAGTGWVGHSASLRERADQLLAVYERR